MFIHCRGARLFGAEQAKLSTEEWLEESELMDSPLDLKPEIGTLSRSRHRLA